MSRPLRVSILSAACVMAVSLAGSQSSAAAEDPAKALEGVPFRYDSGGRRDPFVPLVREGRLVAATPGAYVGTSTPVLYGILWDAGGDSIAMINDTEVRVGDTIGGYQVKEIRQDAVVLGNEGEPLVLQITFEQPPKRSSGTTTGGEGP